MPLTNIEELKKYTILYHLVSEPHLIFSALTTTDQLFEFKEKLDYPATIGVALIQCMFAIYDEDGVIKDIQVKPVNQELVNYTCNTVPLKMLQELKILQINRQEQQQLDQQHKQELIKVTTK